MSTIEALAALRGEMQAWRRDLHAYPETSFEEHRTSALVASQLRSFGVEVHEGWAKTGVVGTLPGPEGAPSIALRADMDALPMHEENQFPHRSRRDGKMHGCGHDGHTAMLLGAAKYLAETRGFVGTVHFVFQPAEEGDGGARRMVEEGLFERFPAQAVFGLHNWPGMPVGTCAVRPGSMMAAYDAFEIRLFGRGCHAAMPHMGVDPVLIGAELVTALQSIVSRKIAPHQPAVVSVTQFHAGEAWAVTPEMAMLRGTARSFETGVSSQIRAELTRLSHLVAEAHGARAEVMYECRNPPTVNTEYEARFAADVAARLFGEAGVDRNPAPSMGAEDFAVMLEAVPGAYCWLGNGSTEGGCVLHSPHYDFNDEVLPLGAAFWVELVHAWMKRGNAVAAP